MCMSSSLGIHIILHLPVEFRPNRTIRDIVMTSYPVSKMLSVSFFVTPLIWKCRNLHADEISARHLDPRLIYYYFRFLKTNVRHVGILFPVPTFTFAHHRHFILHLPTKFRPNWTIHDRVMTLYPFSKMAATVSQFYFRFRFSWLPSFGNVEIYLDTKFRRDISIRGCCHLIGHIRFPTSVLL